ncbi:MAG: RNA polymerase subunit sigma [Opitutae bacterium]|nr:RNA polymerase subunit sigma [Opitutae bacterium]
MQNHEQESLQIYLQQISEIPLISVQDEIDLAAKIKNGDQDAREKMITANLRLVVKIAKEYSNIGLSLLDLINEGNIGLMKAVERFDPTKGGKLSTYASWWIKQSIKRALANQSKPIRLPIHMVDRVTQIRRTSTSLAEKLGRDPTDDELAAEMDLPVSRITHLKAVSQKPASLDSPIGDDDGSTLSEVVPDDKSRSPLEHLQSKSLIGDISSVLDQLEPREAEIMRLRFGLEGLDPHTLEEVGEKIGVTRERVRQLQQQALRELRKSMAKMEKQRTLEEVRHDNLVNERTNMLKSILQKANFNT